MTRIGTGPTSPGFTTSRYLERVYPIPRPYLSHEDWERHHHRDLAAMSTGELRREGRRAQRRMDCTARSHPFDRAWLAERLAAVGATLRERGAAT